MTDGWRFQFSFQLNMLAVRTVIQFLLAVPWRNLKLKTDDLECGFSWIIQLKTNNKFETGLVESVEVNLKVFSYWGWVRLVEDTFPASSGCNHKKWSHTHMKTHCQEVQHQAIHVSLRVILCLRVNRFYLEHHRRGVNTIIWFQF